MKKYIYHIKEPVYQTRWQFPLAEIFPQLSSRKIQVHELKGDQSSTSTDDGSFTNFVDTHYIKNTQINHLFKLIKSGRFKSGSIVFFDDAWNVTILQLKYIMDLLNLDAKIIAYWHAGVHDDFDFLGRLIKNKDWAFDTERALFNAIDINCFATDFYKNMFVEKVLKGNEVAYKILVTAQPHDNLVHQLRNFPKAKKEDLVIFPHRLAVEKQPEIFRDLAKSMPDVNFYVCQESKLTKEEYYKVTSRAKLSFSASRQETFGIACSIDAPLLDCIPLVPKRLSYTEIFNGYDDFVYPSEWTLDWESYLSHKHEIIERIRHTLFEYYILLPKLKKFCDNRLPEYTSASKLINLIVSE